MDIRILDSWLREYLDTKADSREFAKFLSLSGPTVDRTHTYNTTDKLYEIEVTSNRVDAMSVYGIAREAAAILPQYGFESTLKALEVYGGKLPQKGLPLTLVGDENLVYRLMGVVVEDIQNWETPKWMIDRLESAGMRSLNAIVDITNYVMHETGHPCHVFDYDKLPNQKLVVRESKKGEKVTSFDNKTYTLSGGDIVFDDGDGTIIDLPGIIGTKNSVVTKDTKRVLFFFDTNSAKHIRKTSMELAIRTNAAVLNEKGVDPELAEVGLLRGLLLFTDVCKATIASPIYDSYLKKPVSQSISVDKEFISRILDIDINDKEIEKILTSLGFDIKTSATSFEIDVPTFRSNDVINKESIVEEIARIYGYHNLPSKIMDTAIPSHSAINIFDKEMSIKQQLTKVGFSEVYTFSLVSKEMAGDNALKLTNPLGSDTEYLRTSLMPALVQAAKDNAHTDRLSFYELSKVFIPQKNKLPEEVQMLGIVFKGYTFIDAKQKIESFLRLLNISYSVKQVENEDYVSGGFITFIKNKEIIMTLGLLPSGYIYAESEATVLLNLMQEYPQFTPMGEYPAQIEDMTVVIKNQDVIDVYETIRSADKLITHVEVVDVYENSYTFRIHYQSPDKTLTDKEVEKIRTKIEKKLKS